MRKRKINILPSYLSTIVTQIFEHPVGPANKSRTLLVYDEDSELARLLSTAYRQILPHATVIDFNQSNAAKIKEAISTLSAGDLVILVQSTSFRLDAFRIRVHLFEQRLKVIEHPHLGRVRKEEIETYVASLEYDKNYYHRVGPELKNKLDQAKEVKLISGEHALIYNGELEVAKLNIGDYRGMKNVGGQFPIGEVFTELQDLTRLNGTVALFAFGDQNFSVFNCKTPIHLEIKEGKVIQTHSTLPEFESVLAEIRAHEGDIWVRELGFGLNRALTRTSQIRHDVGIYERMCGTHLSLGSKHALYPKTGFHKKKVKCHVDVFAAIDLATIDGEVIYQNGAYTL